MVKLDPILVERYSKQFDRVISLLQSAADLLIPDAYDYQKQQLYSAMKMVQDQKEVYDSVLNSLSVGVLFQEGVQIKTSVEQDVNRTVLGLLWTCLDLISNINLFRSDFADFMESVVLDNFGQYNLKDFVLVESQVDSLCDALSDASDIICQVISSLDN